MKAWSALVLSITLLAGLVTAQASDPLKEYQHLLESLVEKQPYKEIDQLRALHEIEDAIIFDAITNGDD